MDRSTLSEIVSQYASHLQAEKGLTPASQERYLALARGLLALCRHDPDALFLPPDWSLADLDRRVVESYLNALKAERGWKPMSHAFYVTALSAFFGFLKVQHRITRNPCARLRPRLSGELDDLPKGGSEAVLRLFEERGDTVDGARRLLVLELLYGAGLRPTEAFHLAALELQAKGLARYRIAGEEAWRDLPLSPAGSARAERYLRLRAERVSAKHALAEEFGTAAKGAAVGPIRPEAFWIDRRGMACSPARLARQVARAMEAQGLSGGPSTLRVLAARHFSERGGDVRSLQRLLKARRLGQLDRFIPELDLKALTAQFRKAHPRQSSR